MKKSILVLLFVIFSLTFASCSNETKQNQSTSDIKDTTITVEQYMDSLLPEQTAHLTDRIDLLLHPVKDAISLFGNDYSLSRDGSYATLTFEDVKCSVVAYVGTDNDEDVYGEPLEFSDCNPMEYISFASIEKIVFDAKGCQLTDGISVGMSTREIAEKLKVSTIDYKNSAASVEQATNDAGNVINVYTIAGEISELDYVIVFEGDKLAQVEIINSTGYLRKDNDSSDNGKQTITEAFSFVSKNDLASFDINDLSFQGQMYSSYYGSYFYRWQFADGDYKEYFVDVEQDAPYRVCITSSSGGVPITFWCDGAYSDPLLSFLGKWRGVNQSEYIDIKSISKEGIVIFDMYTHIENSNEMILLENLNTVINEIPNTLADCLYAEHIDEAFDGDVQFYNGIVQSGYYGYGGDKFYLIDSLFLNLNGSVQYLPRSIGGRIGTEMLTVHIPCDTFADEQPGTFGYMEFFGRDDTNDENIISSASPNGKDVINTYRNKISETSGLDYASLEYTYLYDYLFTINDETYHVWESKDKEAPHYLYVDDENEIVIKECTSNAVLKHTKDLVFKEGNVIGYRSYAYQKYATLDGKITVDLEDRTITMQDSIVTNVSFSDLIYDSVGQSKRFMFFCEIGKQYALNGYVLFDHVTWGATLHITDSNIPDFPPSVYFLNSETFFIDSAVGIVTVPDDNSNEEVDNKIEEANKETKLVIREYSGKVIGYIHVDEKGNKKVRNFSGKLLGYYYVDRDVTTDFSGRVLARGDITSALLFSS